MSVTLTIKYPGKNETLTLENVPYTANISKIKKMIIKANHFEGDPEKVNIVNHGKILRPDDTIGSLPLDGEQQITLFAVGIQSRFKSNSEPVSQAKQQNEQNEEKEQNEDNHPHNIPPVHNNFTNQNQPQPHRNPFARGRTLADGPKKQRNFSMSNVVNILIILVVLLGFSAAFVSMFLRKGGNPFSSAQSQITKSHSSPISIFFKYFTLIFVLLLFIIPMTRIHWTIDLFKTVVVVFFKSILPSFTFAEIPRQQARRIH